MRFFIFFVLSFFYSATSYANCGASNCNVLNFAGTFDQQIESAIAAAKQTSHKTVYIPNGKHQITRTINISDPIDQNEKSVVLKIIGQSTQYTTLSYNISPGVTSDNTSFIQPLFNVEKVNGFQLLDLLIDRLSIDMQITKSYSIYLNPSENAVSTSGHAIRVRDGYTSGRMKFSNLVISSPPGYGIGIQNNGNRINADNVVIQSVVIVDAGSDAVDTKAPNRGANSNLRIFDLKVLNAGLNDDSAGASGLDIRYDDFYVRGYTFEGNAVVESRLTPGRLVTINGVSIRPFTRGGTLYKMDIRGGNHGVVLDDNNSDIIIKTSLIRNSRIYGVWIRNADDIELKDGCVYSTGRDFVRIEDDSENINNKFANRSDSPPCPSRSSLGSKFNPYFPQLIPPGK